MNYFICIVFGLAAYTSIKTTKSIRARKLFIRIYAAIFSIGFIYLFGKAIGEAFYNLSH
ncbi:hypothetical protein [Gillisia sp. CAL575]|uniref:hypothetical protein n=1 Tax=Gillisia sp. CAL575 TaxID=985255 RepID=UPI00039FFED6|nr:hypothetical protein [Gillisia sp. CAL575]